LNIYITVVGRTVQCPVSIYIVAEMQVEEEISRKARTQGIENLPATLLS
jgi:hypothetical protein